MCALSVVSFRTTEIFVARLVCKTLYTEAATEGFFHFRVLLQFARAVYEYWGNVSGTFKQHPSFARFALVANVSHLFLASARLVRMGTLRSECSANSFCIPEFLGSRLWVFLGHTAVLFAF